MRFLAPLVLAAGLAAPLAAGERVCGTLPDGRQEARLLHRYWAAARGTRAAPLAATDTRDGDLLVLSDRGDLVAGRNPFDLDRSALRFAPRGEGYAVARVAVPLEPPPPSLQLGPDAAREVALPFDFVFFGRRQRSVFVHSDGCLTFERADAGAGALGMRRFLDGPPRIGALFTDLDPARGGSVSVRLGADRAVFVWDGVPGGGQINRNSFQATLLPDGQVELAWGEVQTREAIVGLAPGAGGGLTVADFSQARPPAAEGALVERFSERDQLDLVSVARRLYASWPDAFDQVVVYTARPLNPLGGSLAFEINVSNDVRGIGLEVFDDAAQWGSAGELESVVFMDAVDPYLDVDGFEVLAHEVGHRWLARLRFRGAPGRAGTELLGRGAVHWSFFLDSDASVMEGNDIEDLGGGRFRTVDLARGYSALDQYVMGLRSAEEVPQVFYVEQADDFRPHRTYKASSAPEAGVSFTGIRRDVHIEDVLAEMGPRQPDARRAPRLLRQAWVLVEDAAAAATPERRAAVNRIRMRFEEYFRQATGGRGSVDTRLP